MPENKPLKNRFDDFSAEPRTEVWSRIEAELDNKPKRRSVIWWWSAAVLLILVTGAKWFITTSGDQDTSNLNSNKNSTLGSAASSGQAESQQAEAEPSENNNTNANHSIQSNAFDHEKVSSSQHKSTQTTRASINKSTDTTNFVGVNSSKNKEQTPTIATLELEPLNMEFDADTTGLVSLPTISPSQLDTADQSLQSQEIELQMPLNDKSIAHVRVPYDSKWSITLHGGVYRTAVEEIYYFNPIYLDLSSGIPAISNEAFQSNSLSFYRHIVHGLGMDLAYQLSPRWQLKSGMNVLMYRTKMVNENSIQRGSNYYQLAMGADYTLLNIKRFQWQIGTGIGSGLLRNQVVGGVENHWRSEWNINTALSYSINPKWAIRLQPTSRLIISDTQVEGFGKLSKWYHGANVGVTFRF